MKKKPTVEQESTGFRLLVELEMRKKGFVSGELIEEMLKALEGAVAKKR